MDVNKIKSDVEHAWNDSIQHELCEYIKIPNKSPSFDPDWKKNGHMDRAMEQVVAWCKKQPIRGMKLEELQLEGRTPLLLIEIDGDLSDSVLLYGHIDKQPEMIGWSDGKGPWTPVIEGDKLYGRGGADDGYAVFASLTAIKNLQAQNLPHGRCVLVIEASEESGSSDLPAYLDHLGSRIGSPDLIVCLDSGCGNYETLWSTTSLRGVITADLHIQIQKEGMHSGQGSGIVPSWYTVLNQLIARIEDPKSGQIFPKELNVTIPDQNREQAEAAAEILKDSFKYDFTFVGTTRPVSDNIGELLLNQSWRPALTVTGIDGVPSIKDAGNVTLPRVSVKLSLRVPPTCEVDQACLFLKETFEREPPYGADIRLTNIEAGGGWKAPALAPWLEEASHMASEAFFGQKSACIGEGGSIPFMGMLGKKFPKAQFLITGLLGPNSNAHGPNEFLHIPMFKKLTCAISSVLHSHYQYRKKP